MNVLYTSFLIAGIFLMFIPLILHLILHYRRKVVELSTFRFLFETYFREGKAMKILEYLLLACRMAALLFLGTFFAKPALSPGKIGGYGRSSRAIVIIIDTSASMYATEAGITRMEMAKELTREILARCKPSDEISLINSHYDAEVLAAHISGDMPLIISKLESIQPTYRTGRIGPALSKATAILRETSLRKKSIYFLSDMQKSAWDRYTHEREQALFERDMSLCLVRIGEPKLDNCTIIPDAGPRTRAFLNVPFTIKCWLANLSANRKDILFTVTKSREEKDVTPPLRRELITLQPAEQKLVEIVHQFERPGTHFLDFQISGDSFSHDDNVTMSITVFPVANVLLVGRQIPNQPLSDSCFYIARALQPDLSGKDPMKILVNQTFCDYTQLAPHFLTGKHVAILSDVPSLSPQAAAALKQFVNGGGGLLIFYGETVDPSFYRSLTTVSNDFNGSFLPGFPLRTYSGQEDPSRFTYFSSIDFKHPSLALFQGAYASSLTMPRFYRIWELGMPEDNRFKSIAAFSIGLDAIREHRYGRGKVITCAFPAQVGWSSLPLKPAFVPLIHQLTAYLCPDDWKDQLRETEIDEPFRVVMPHSLRNSELAVTDPAGKIFNLKFKPEGNLYVAETNLSEKGIYKLMLKCPDKTSDNAEITTKICYRESILESLTENYAKRIIPNANITFVAAGRDISRIAEDLTAGKPLWRFFAWLVLFVLLTEFIIANRLFFPRVINYIKNVILNVRRIPWLIPLRK